MEVAILPYLAGVGSNRPETVWQGLPVVPRTAEKGNVYYDRWAILRSAGLASKLVRIKASNDCSKLGPRLGCNSLIDACSWVRSRDVPARTICFPTKEQWEDSGTTALGCQLRLPNRPAHI